jgi:glycerol-3-phosphate dehydrogenase
MADPSAKPIIAPSQGVHLVLDGSFLAGDSAIMVPHTSDGRVMFAIPWHGHTLVGTTDTPVAQVSVEPVAQEQEIEFLLHTASLYLAKKPQRSDVTSVFAGIRPLVREGHSSSTAALSRSHTIRIEPSGMVTVCGGKWTTYRNMAEDCVNQATRVGHLPERECVTEHLAIHGSDAGALPLDQAVVLAVREEMARTVEGVLARRTRALFLNAAAAIAMAPRVAALMAHELGRDAEWEAAQVHAFEETARGFLPVRAHAPSGLVN